MNKISILIILIIGIAGCKKDGKKPTVDYNSLIIGRWANTKNIDSVIQSGQPTLVDSISIPLAQAQVYTFNSDKTGVRDDGSSSIHILHFNYSVSATAFNFFNIQLYQLDGTPLNVSQTPYTNEVVKFTSNQFVFRFVNTYGSPVKTVISSAYYTKIN